MREYLLSFPWNGSLAVLVSMGARYLYKAKVLSCLTSL